MRKRAGLDVSGQDVIDESVRVGGSPASGFGWLEQD
jgi:hypothetical protein